MMPAPASASSTGASPVADSAAWIAAWLQLNDTFYPTGAYAHSYGLEGLVELGVVRDRATLREYLLASVLPSLRQTELPLAVHAWKLFSTASIESAQSCDWEKLRELSELSCALKTSREARLAANNIGRQRAELLAALRPSDLSLAYLTRAREGQWPYSPAISAALEARVLGAPLDAVLGALVYATVAGLLAAAMKILRLGQNGSQTLLTEMLAHTPELAAAAQKVAFADIGWFNPWLDIAAARHENAAARLFIS